MLVDPETMKHRIVHFLQKYLFNPPIGALGAWAKAAGDGLDEGEG
jgi:hypothetical protein